MRGLRCRGLGFGVLMLKGTNAPLKKGYDPTILAHLPFLSTSASLGRV